MEESKMWNKRIYVVLCLRGEGSFMKGIMYILAAMLLACWVLGYVVAGIMHPLVHVLLLVAVVIVLYQYLGRDRAPRNSPAVRTDKA